MRGRGETSVPGTVKALVTSPPVVLPSGAAGKVWFYFTVYERLKKVITL